MKRLLKTYKADVLAVLPVFVLITVCGVVFHQSFWRILPLYVSLIVARLQAHVNRYASLLGGLNSFLYVLVYVHYGLYASALSAALIAGPFQIATFIRWQKHAYKHSTELRRMTVKQRAFTTVAFFLAWALFCFVLGKIDGAAYSLFDSANFLFGLLITILTLLAYVEYTALMIPNMLVNIALFAVMTLKAPEQSTYLVYFLFALFCHIQAYFRARSLYREQQTAKKAEPPQGDSTV